MKVTPLFGDSHRDPPALRVRADAIGDTVISPQSTRKLNRAVSARYRFVGGGGGGLGRYQPLYEALKCSRPILVTWVGIPDSRRKARS